MADAAGLLGLCLAMAASWYRKRYGWRALDATAARRLDVFLIGIGASACTLFSPLTWLHYFTLVVPLALCALKPCPGAARQVRQGLAFVGAALIVQLPAELFPGLGDPATPSMVTSAAYLLLVLAVLDLALRAQARSRRAALWQSGAAE